MIRVRCRTQFRNRRSVHTLSAMVAMSDYAAARFHMVEGQLRPNKVIDQTVVAAMLNVPREAFVPKPVRGIAYVDEDLPVGNGRYLLEPLIFARLIQAAEIRPQDVALDIGCATGYSTAVLARLAATVVATEVDAALASRATETLRSLGIDNAVVYGAPLTQGYPSQAPYDVIVMSGAVADVPSAILDQLAEGGRLVTVVSPTGHMGEAKLFRRIGGVIASLSLFETATPLLPGFEPQPHFKF